MTDLKKLLLAGTAVVAIGATSSAALAADVDLSAATGTWSSDGTNLDDGTVAEAEAGADLNASVDSTLTVTNDTTANDGGGTNSFTLGDVTDTADKTLNIVVTSGTTADLAVTMDSVNIDGNFTITGDAADDATIAVTLDDAAVASTIGGNLVINNSAADAADTATLTAQGALTVTGTTAVTAGTVANSGASFVAEKAATFTGAVTFTGGGNAAADATGLFQGNTTFTGGATLDDATGQAVLTFDVATDGTGLTVAGAIDGAAAGEGDLIIVDNATTTTDTVTFSGNIGATNAVNTITIGATGADGGHAVFNGTVGATTITVGVANPDGDTATADFNGNVTATNLNILGGDTAGETGSVTAAGNVTAAVDLDDATGGDGTAKITYDGTSAQTQTGAITTDDGEGSVVVASGASVTFANTIGTGAAGLDNMSVAGTATVQDDVFTNNDAATDAGLTVDGTLNIDSSTNGVDILEDVGDIDFNGTVSITGDNATSITATSDLFIDGTFTTALDGVALTLESAANNVAVGATSDTTLSIGNAVTLNGDLAVSGDAGKTVTLAINKTANFDPDTTTLITAAGDTVDIDSDGKLVVSIASTTQEFDGGETITVIDSDENVELDNVDTTYAALITSGDVVLEGSAFLTLSDNSSTAQDLLVTVGVKNASTVLTGSSFNNQADVLLQTITDANTTAELDAFRGAVQGAATAAAAQALLEGAAPAVDGSAQVGALAAVTNSALGITGERMAAVRSGDTTGMAAGNMTHGLQVWGQVFGSTGEQDNRDGVSGYEVDGWGITAGVDTQTLAEDWVFGMAFTYADTEFDSDNSVNTQTDVDTYQIALYADYAWDAATYVNGQLGYASNSGDQSKTNVGGAGLTANADVDSDVFFARLETGRDYDMDNGWTLTPIALMNYQYIDTDNYSETGTCGTLCLTNVDTDSMSVFELGIGGEASYLHQNADGSFLKPKLHASYRYDFIGDEVETTAAFSGVSGTTFTNQGYDAQQSTFNVGAGLSFYSTSNFEVSANYDYEIKEDYDAHNGYIRAGFKF